MDKVGDKVWIATAPNGVSSSGPTVIYDLSEYGVYPQETITAYKGMGFSIIEAVITKVEV